MVNVRLAYHPEGGATLKSLAPTVRMALSNSPAERNGTLHNLREFPAILVSFYYLEPFLKNRALYSYRDWVMDSGAFSAHFSGKSIDIMEYIEKCKELIATDSKLTEVFSLDVIGDWRKGVKNLEKMWNSGIRAIPCYHIGEPESLLVSLAKEYPKIALGGVALAKGGIKMEFAKQCFSRVWPKKIHGFGYGSQSQILALPWHSVDATNWEIGPCKFGRWQKFGNMSVRGTGQNLKSEVKHYLEIESKARAKWSGQMEKLESTAPTVRLAVGGTHTNGGRYEALK